MDSNYASTRFREEPIDGGLVAIETRDLTRTFGGQPAVDRLSLQVPYGIIFGFLGPNGAGKTTTIRLLLGLLEPTAGEIRVLGYDVRTQADQVRQQVGVLLEQPGLYTRMSVYDNLAYFTNIYCLSGTDRQEGIRTMLQRVGLWERRHDRVETLSRGMKQKLAFVRALLHQPPLIFLDEPTSGLDAPSAVALRQAITELVKQSGVTVFVSTNNLTEAEQICDQVAIINQGRLIALGTLAELRRQAREPRLLEVYGRGFTPEVLATLKALPGVARTIFEDRRLLIELHWNVEASSIVRRLVEASAEVEEVHGAYVSLEEVFLALVRESA